MKRNIECSECGKKSMFADTKDIVYAKWTIIAWDVKSADPICICDECEYNKPKKHGNTKT